MDRHMVTQTLLSRFAFMHRENQFRHHTLEEEMGPFYFMVDGNREAMIEAMHRRTSGNTGTVSKDPLRNAKYLFVSMVTMACRFCIDAGLDSGLAYNASDLYILRVDECNDIEEINKIAEDMMLFYCDKMIEQKRRARFTRHIAQALDFIETHLHERIILQEVADAVGISRTYLSALFPRECGMSFNEYVLRRRIDVAKDLLRFSDMTISEIAAYLAFTNHSHFDRTFKNLTGETPSAYRNRRDAEGVLPKILND